MSADVRPLLAIDPDAQHVEFRGNACRECGETGPVTLTENPAWHEWFTRHAVETGHTKFYQFKIERSTGETVSLWTTNRKRRTLGQR